MLKLVDLCAGTGAFSYAFEKTGKVRTVFANDFDINSKKIYDINFEQKLTFGNLNNINHEIIPDHDIMTAGFPCQPFSIAGKQKGFDDDRSNIFWSLIDIMEYKDPQIVILENVKNLLTHDNGRTFKIIKKRIEKIGYDIKYSILNTSSITRIPQHRERLFICCFLEESDYDKFNFDFSETINNHIKKYLDIDIPNKYYYTKTSHIYPTLKKTIIKKIDDDIIYQYRRYYVRQNMNNLCPTLTANMGTGGHNVPIILDNKGIRKLTPRECFNLQGFPRTYKLPKLSDGKLYKLAGNAVSLSVVKKIVNKLME